MSRQAKPPLARYINQHESWRWTTPERMASDIDCFLHEDDLDEFEQVMSYALMPLTPSIETMRSHALGPQVIRWCLAQGSDYAPASLSGTTPARLVGCLIGSLIVDLAETGYIRTRTLSSAFARIEQALESSPSHWARRPPEEYNLALLGEMKNLFGGGVLDLETGIGSELVFAVQTWQRLHWLAECRRRQALVFSSRLSERLPADPLGRVALLHRLGWSQPLLRRWPELARTVPRDPLRLLPPGDALGLVVRDFARADKDLEQRFLLDATAHRRYTLDHVAVIELDQSGLNALALAPERRYGEDGFITAYAVDHRAGVFFGETHLVPEPGGGQGLVMSYLPLCDTLGYADEVENPKAATPNQVMDTFALLTTAAWRDLVSENVREEQYVSHTERKAKAHGRRSKARGDVAVIRYLPRRLAARRAQVEAAREQGSRLPPRRYSVGAFSRRLPAGQRRSPAAEEYAREIGIPLASYQTIVHPHSRGGAGEGEDGSDRSNGVRRYRSWSALDLLRTRD